MITISTPNYEIVTVNGKDYVIFYPQFLKNGDWATVGDENPLPVKIVELDTVKFWTEQLLETSEKNKEKLEQLNELISEMSMLSKGPKGDTRYMWIKYADDEKGSGMSDDPNDKKYIGMAFNKDIETPSDDPKDYVWTKYVADFEGIEIGGRNLLPSSYDLYNLGGTYGYIKLSDSPTIVKIYDKDVDVDIDGVYFGLTNNGTNSSGGYRWIVNGGNIDNEYYSGVINDYPYFSFFPKTREVFNKIFRRFNIKIERGTIPTDWSPALEDINKDFVGLSNVQNYGIALESQAKAGVSNAVYMTPLRTKQAIDEQRPVLIPRKTADVAGSEYPVGVSFMDIEGYGVSDGYPQNFGTVVTYKSADNRISQEFIGNGLNENQEDKWMRHYHPNNANNGWTEWKKQVQEDQVRLIADKRITEDEVLIIYEDGTFEQEGTYLAKDMTIDTKIGEVYRSSNISLPDPYAQPSTSFFNLSISGEHNTWLTRIADNNFVIVRLASFLERTTPSDYLLSYRYFGRWK